MRIPGPIMALALVLGCAGEPGAPAVEPEITTPPQPVTVNAGEVASFSVTAIGTEPLGYQWSLFGIPIVDATSSTYAFTTTGEDDGAEYSVRVTNSAGTATSAPALLTVRTAPVIETEPADAAVDEGEAASFSVTVTGTAPFTYQWRRNGIDIPGATSSGYVLSTTAADDGALFSVIVANVVGSVASRQALLEVRIPETASMGRAE